MKKFLSTLFLSFCILLSVADPLYGGSTPNTPYVTTVAKKSPTASNRPRIPSMSTFEMRYYQDQELCVFDLSDTDIKSMFVEIENLETGETYYDTVDASYPCMNVTLTAASYSVTCTTDDESIYTGAFEIM